MQTQTRVTNEINALIDREGDYVNHAMDRGGPTRWGITQVVARAHGYYGDMRELPKQAAFDIYLLSYWTKPKLDQISERHSDLAIALFDWGVNSGPSHGIKAMQRALNVMVPKNPTGKPDGIIGPATLRSLDAYTTARGARGLTVLTDIIHSQRQVFLIEIAERNPTQTAFSYGWARRVTELR